METQISDKTVLETITENYDKIFQAEKKVADFILKNPNVAVNSNVSELANYSGISDATVIRFCKHLGYDGYYQMRLCLSRDIGRRNGTLQISEESNTSLSGMYKKIAQSVLASRAEIEESEFCNIIDLITHCNSVHIVAAGNTSPICMHYGSRIERLGIRCTYSMLAEHYLGHINTAQEKDIILGVSESGTSKTVVKALELAKEKGLVTIAITGFRYSPVSRIADHLLISTSSKLGAKLFSHTSRLNEIIVLEVLTHALETALAIKEETINEQEMLLSESKL